MEESIEFAMNQLFRAKWNIPQACQHMGLVNREVEWEYTKEMFRKYCGTHPKDHFSEHQ
jgi:hypothetical protein